MNKKIGPFWLLFTLTGLNLFNYMDRYIVSAVRTPLAADFAVGYGDSGRIFTAFMIGYFITSPLFGYLGDRTSRKWLIGSGIFIWSLGTVLTGFASHFWQLILFRSLVGIGEASYASISPSLISDTWGPDNRNNALTIFYAAIPVGSAIGYILGGVVATHWGWRYSFFWAGAPGLFLAFVLLPFKEPMRGESESIDTKDLSKPGFRDALRLLQNIDYLLVVVGYIAYTFALGAFAFWGPTFLEKVHRLSNAEANSFFGGVIVISGLLGTLLGGFAATSWQRRNPAGYAWLLSGSMLFAVPSSTVALLSSNATLTMPLLAFSIFLLFLCTGPVNTLILESVPVTLRSSAMALSIFMIHLFGDMGSPEIVGRIADHLRNNLQKALLILPGFLLIAGLLWLILALKTLKATQRTLQLITPAKIRNSHLF